MTFKSLKLAKTMLSLLVFSMLISCESTHRLTSIPHPDVETLTIRGKEIEIIETEDLSIGITGIPENNTVKYIVSMVNKQHDPLLFDFSSLRAEKGNYERGQWKPLSVFTAQEYVKRLQTKNAWEAVLIGVAAGVNSINASYSSSTSYGSFYAGGSRYSYTAYTNTYNPAAGQLASLATLSAASDLFAENQMDIETAETYYLGSSQLFPGEPYTGVVYTKQGNAPDYKLSFDINDSEYSFYFRRSDYQEVLNPWLDRTKPRHSVLVSYTPQLKRYGMYYKYVEPKGLGGYMGVTLGTHAHSFITQAYNGYYYDNPGTLDGMYGVDPDLGDGKGSYAYDWRIAPLEKDPYLTSDFGFLVGLTYKIMPYTWLMGGIGLEYPSSLYTYGSLYYTTSGYNAPLSSYTYFKDAWVESTYRGVPSMIVPLQVGLSWIFNFIDIGVLYTWRLTEAPFSTSVVEILAGIAF